jgi:hypothetical protein
MIVLAFALLLAQAPAAMPSPTPMPSFAPPPQIPTAQQIMGIFRQFRPELAESRRQLMTAITQALTPEQLAAIAADIGADAVADKPNVTALTSEIDSVLTPPSRTAIAEAFERYAVRQQALSKQIQAALPMQQSGEGHAQLIGPTPQPIEYVPADAARLLAHRPIGMGMLRPEHAQPLFLAPMLQLRQTMRARMLAALTPAHRIAVGQLYGQTAMGESGAGQGVSAQIDALLTPAERQGILSAHAQFVAESLKQIEASKAAAEQQIQAMGSDFPPALVDAMKRQIDALQTPPPVPVDAGSALFSALMVPTAAL